MYFSKKDFYQFSDFIYSTQMILLLVIYKFSQLKISLYLSLYLNGIKNMYPY